jgi:hypothetical protein
MRNTVFGIAGAMLTAFVSTLAVWFGVVALVGEHQAIHNYGTQMIGNATLGVVVGMALLLYATYVGSMPLRTVAFSWNTRDTIYTGAMILLTLGMAAGTMLLFDRMGRHAVTFVAPRWGFVALGLVGQIGVVHEELLFRGYILPRVDRHTGPAVGILISAVLFTLMHIPFKGAGFMTVSWLLGGLLYGYLYLKSGSLLVTIATHAIHNWALDLFMYSRAGVSLFQFAAIRLVGMEKIGFALALTVVLGGLTYAIYGRGNGWLAPSPRLATQWRADANKRPVSPNAIPV